MDRKEVNKMNIVRWDPFRDMVSLRQAMDRLMEDSFVRPSRALRLMGEEAFPAIDVYQKPEELVVKASLPGLKPEEVDITISGDTLTITGETKADEEVKREDYIYQEHRYGAFTRSLALPPDLRTDKAEASFDNGVLTLTIPRAEEVKPKTVKVTTKGLIEGEKKEAAGKKEK